MNAVNNFRNGAGYAKRLRKQIQQQQPPPPAPPLMTVIPPAALVTATELPQSSSPSVSSLLEEKKVLSGETLPSTHRGPEQAVNRKDAIEMQ
ncbi:hypothetical protein AAES_127179 [Amazona aestiva]|uniref:Uncharacterized protein n=1 Tax=Amazona aestiva TaxID=12930 RepID=A0A0Q3P8S6_AMAAE|nr:hypothetical protein AAES_127179 [Amazona aestiva]